MSLWDKVVPGAKEVTAVVNCGDHLPSESRRMQMLADMAMSSNSPSQFNNLPAGATDISRIR